MAKKRRGPERGGRGSPVVSWPAVWPASAFSILKFPPHDGAAFSGF